MCSLSRLFPASTPNKLPSLLYTSYIFHTTRLKNEMQLLPFDSTNHTSTKVDIQSDAICTMICTAILADFRVVFRKKPFFYANTTNRLNLQGIPFTGLRSKPRLCSNHGCSFLAAILFLQILLNSGQLNYFFLTQYQFDFGQAETRVPGGSTSLETRALILSKSLRKRYRFVSGGFAGGARYSACLTPAFGHAHPFTLPTTIPLI